MKEFLRTLAPTNWFRESPLPEGAEHPEGIEPGNGLSFTGDIDHSIPEDDYFEGPKAAAPAETITKPSQPELPVRLPEKIEKPAKEETAKKTAVPAPSPTPELMPRLDEGHALPEVTINETAKKQLVSADELLEQHWQAFQAAARDRKHLMDEFEQALRDSCRPTNDKPTVLGAVFLAKRKVCADALVDTLEDVELSLKKLLDKERRLLKGIHATQLPGWMREIQAHRLEIESHLMTGAAASVPSRVSLSEEE
ncbi:MAG: hypothetical protein B0D91_11105 [Oceanospirillales bacterium LUC14_002_19_P2]|nr:MAG: hypothetical protein B0D91_11105 [Oceanospirillales bacterium LUC14_002_19_P2]